MKSAFSQIELIFVILIIGILAATAFPKLAATRDDAKMSTIAHNTMVAATDIASYAVAKGQTETDLSRMSDAIATMVNHGVASQVAGTPTLNIHWGGVNNCLVLKIEGQNTPTETLVLETNGSSSDECDRLRSLIDSGRFPIPLHGSRLSL
ncbi:type II secretion system protein [Nitratifractor sp.]|uniref:type II secretion system protein n=1 Tax=Nitratifractor sp. TaxID=2268144 RepID=UPI0025DDB0D5|nr:type II secretion system protein [Nitratifractor sp.]